MHNEQHDNTTARPAVPITQFGDPVLRLRAQEVDLDEIRSPEIQNIIEVFVASRSSSSD